MDVSDPEFGRLLSEMHHTDPRRGIQIRLLDETDGCYVTYVPADSFSFDNVSTALDRATALFRRSYLRDELDRGGEPYDPFKWEAEVAERRAAVRRKRDAEAHLFTPSHGGFAATQKTSTDGR